MEKSLSELTEKVLAMVNNRNRARAILEEGREPHGPECGARDLEAFVICTCGASKRNKVIDDALKALSSDK